MGRVAPRQEAGEDYIRTDGQTARLVGRTKNGDVVLEYDADGRSIHRWGRSMFDAVWRLAPKPCGADLAKTLRHLEIDVKPPLPPNLLCAKRADIWHGLTHLWELPGGGVCEMDMRNGEMTWRSR